MDLMTVRKGNNGDPQPDNQAERCPLCMRVFRLTLSQMRQMFLWKKWPRDMVRWKESDSGDEGTQELRGEEEGRKDGERKDIDFHLKEAISATQELQGLCLYVRLCVCVCVCVVCVRSVLGSQQRLKTPVHIKH